MHHYTIDEILQAARDDEGFCLACGAQQPYQEPRLYLGLCEECDQQSVLPAETLARAVELIDLEGDEG